MDKTYFYDGKHCPYCGEKSKFIDSHIIYGKSYGMVYMCLACDAYCGVHRGTKKSLGRLANKELRDWKKNAHSYFDPLWQRKIKQGFKRHKAKSLAYKWLSKQMNTPIEFTHIGMFDIEQCKQVIEICKPYN